MNKRRPIRINVELPELTAVQAELLAEFLEDLANDVWKAYEDDLFDLDAERFRSTEGDYEPTDADCENLRVNRAEPYNSIKDDDPNPDF